MKERYLVCFHSVIIFLPLVPCAVICVSILWMALSMSVQTTIFVDQGTRAERFPIIPADKDITGPTCLTIARWLWKGKGKGNTG